MPDYHSPPGPPGPIQPQFKPVDCDNLFEVLMSKIDKPHEYTHIIAELICRSVTSLTTVEHVDGVPMIQDPNRGKTLSMARPIIMGTWCGRNICNRYLKIGDVPSINDQGFYLPRKATITGIWGKSRSTGSWTIEARKNGVQLSVANTSISGGTGESSNIDVDLNEGDCLQVYASGTGISHPIGAVEIAWRK